MRPRNPNESKKKKVKDSCRKRCKKILEINKEKKWRKRNENEALVQRDDII